MLTRSQVARRLGRSIATVRRMEGHDLHPWRGADGVHRFLPEEVQAVLVRRAAGIGSTNACCWVHNDARDLHRHLVPPHHEDGRRGNAEQNFACEQLRLIQAQAVLALESMSHREIGQLDPGILEIVEQLLTIDI